MSAVARLANVAVYYRGSQVYTVALVANQMPGSIMVVLLFFSMGISNVTCETREHILSSPDTLRVNAHRCAYTSSLQKWSTK